MTIDAALREARARLAETSDSPDLDARRLLQHVLSVDQTWLIVHGRDALEPTARSCFEILLERRIAGEPLAYVTGRIGFWTLELAVTPDVLVPRPDTETLVEAVLARHDSAPRRVLDLGTGSGAIALALASERPAWQVVATDASAAALACARANAAALGLDNVAFAHGRWYDALDSGGFDVIVSNPPYVASADPHLAAPELMREPRTALVADDEGLADLAHIAAQAPAWCRPDGRLYLEHGADQGAAVRALLATAGFEDVHSLRDLGDNERVTTGKTPP
jgi:release factor glutamine methyltransferase